MSNNFNINTNNANLEDTRKSKNIGGRSRAVIWNFVKLAALSLADFREDNSLLWIQ